MLLLSFRYAPEDEIEQVRILLTNNDISFYEVPPSFLGFNAGGIWLRHAEQKTAAQALLTEYQQQRALDARKLWDEQKQQGTRITQYHIAKAHPIRFLLTLISIFLLLGLVTIPFWFL